MKIAYETVFNLCFYVVLLTFGVLGYMEYKYHMDACILSYGERSVFLLLTFLFWTGSRYANNADSKKNFAWIGFILSLMGIAIVSRHMWIEIAQSLPTYVGPDLLQTLKAAITGVPDGCAAMYELGYGIRDTEITLTVFIVLAILCFIQQFRHE